MFNAAKDRRERLIAMHSAISPYTPRGGNVRPTWTGHEAMHTCDVCRTVSSATCRMWQQTDRYVCEPCREIIDDTPVGDITKFDRKVEQASEKA